jgi:hypothetical protein
MGSGVYIQFQEMRNIIVIAILLLGLFSCRKPEDRSCAKFTGEEDTLDEHLDYELIQDSTDKVVLIGGKNLLKFVKAEVTDSLLDISNENKCNFLRSLKRKIKVEIHFTRIGNIEYRGTERLTNKGKLKLDYFTFLIKDGAGPVELNFDAELLLAFISHGWGDFTFAGSVKTANMTIRSNGYCDTYGMTVQDSMTLVSRTQGDVKINIDGAKLKAQIEQDGNIYYKGIPTVIKLNKYGNGELINAN